MRIYVSGPLLWQEDLLRQIETFPEVLDCKSRWLSLDGDPEDPTFEREAWRLCVEDIDNADAVLGLISLDLRSPGVHFELGYAVARGVQTVLVAPPVAPYHAWPGVTRVDAVEEAIEELTRLASATSLR